MTNKLLFLDVRNPDAPAVSEENLPDDLRVGPFGVVADPVAPAGFYISTRKQIGETEGRRRRPPTPSTSTSPSAGSRRPTDWAAVYDINTPGRLIRTWKSAAGERMFLSQDTNYRIVEEMMNKRWVSRLPPVAAAPGDVGGKPAAELRDARVLTDLYPVGPADRGRHGCSSTPGRRRTTTTASRAEADRGRRR